MQQTVLPQPYALTAEELLRSWQAQAGIHSNDELLAWVRQRNRDTAVQIQKIPLSACAPWFYHPGTGRIQNPKGAFFSIAGMKYAAQGTADFFQPVILQEEIGFLGILCCKIQGVLHFLMQAKIEPGNVNRIQISPTVQATKSNFTQQHGGRRPDFLDYFSQAIPRHVLVDQVQSEQSSRFLKKRNRNMVVLHPEIVPETDTHKYMTLGQIKRLMREPNLINMDTRTVLSCLPVSFLDKGRAEEGAFSDMPLVRSMLGQADIRKVTEIYHDINDYKMFHEIRRELVPLCALEGWDMDDNGIRSRAPASFSVIYCDISIEGREVKNWRQPLFAAAGSALFGLFTCVDAGIRYFLVKLVPEVGCFDGVELGPTLQREAVYADPPDAVEAEFLRRMERGQGVMVDTVLSEEGGRFYHEQNRNCIIDIEKAAIPLPPRYHWCDYKTLNMLVQINNCLNIQLRNLLSLLEV